MFLVSVSVSVQCDTIVIYRRSILFVFFYLQVNIYECVCVFESVSNSVWFMMNDFADNKRLNSVFGGQDGHSLQ